MNVRICVLIGFMLLLHGAPGAFAKRVLCVSADGTGFVSNAEGYERQFFGRNDVAQVGGALTDCLANVAGGETLTICAHGTAGGGVPAGQSLNWHNGAAVKVYTGFGGGLTEVPIPAGWGALTPVRGRFNTCWSGRDPDGGGPDKSLRDELVAAMGGGPHTITGFSNCCWSTVYFSKPVGGTPAQRAAVKAALLAPAAVWDNNPPINRPGALFTQQDAAQAVADGIAGAGVVTVNIVRYGMPYNGAARAVFVGEEDSANWGCCEDCTMYDPGCGIAEAVFVSDIPTISTWGLVAMTLLVLTAGTIVYARRHPTQQAA